MNRIEEYQKDEEHRPAEDLENDINQTRQRMDQTLDKLSTQLKPDRYFEGAGDWVQGKVDTINGDVLIDTAVRVGKRTSRFIADHPLPVALGALTVASFFMKRSDYDVKVKDPYIPAHPDSDGPTGKIDPTLDPGVKQLPETSENGTSNGRANGKMSHATQAVKGGLSSAAHKTGDSFSRGKDKYPAGMCLGAMALGFLAAFSIPRTRKENQWCGESSDELKHDISDRGHKLVDDAKESLRNRKDKLVQKAKEKTGQAIARSKESVEEKIDDASSSDTKTPEDRDPS